MKNKFLVRRSLRWWRARGWKGSFTRNSASPIAAGATLYDGMSAGV